MTSSWCVTPSQSQELHSVLQMLVRGLAEQPDIALTRIWLIGPGDICRSCPMLSVCPNQTRCLHLVASAGNPLIEAGSGDGAREDWTRINGHFQRIPLNPPFKLGHIATTDAYPDSRGRGTTLAIPTGLGEGTEDSQFCRPAPHLQGRGPWNACRFQ